MLREKLSSLHEDCFSFLSHALAGGNLFLRMVTDASDMCQVWSADATHCVLMPVEEILCLDEKAASGRMVRHPSSGLLMPLEAFAELVRQREEQPPLSDSAPHWTLWGAWRHAVSLGFSCRGRASRQEWGRFLFADVLLLAYCGILGLYVVIGPPAFCPSIEKEILLWVGLWGTFFCQIAAYLLLLFCTQMVRRLHDIGLRGWWCLLCLLVPPLWLLLCFLPSSARPGADADSPSASAPGNGLISAPLRCLNECLYLRGSSSRRDFAAGLLLFGGGWGVFCYALTMSLPPHSTPAWQVVALMSPPALILFTLSFISVSVRRLHDCHRSAWWALAGLCPVTALPWMLYLLMRSSVTPVAYPVAPPPRLGKSRKINRLRGFSLSVLSSFTSCVRRWDDYESRTPRMTFWPPFLAGQFLLGCSLWGAMESMYYLDAAYREVVSVSFLLVCWAYLLFLIPLCIRRLHDMNRSGFLSLLWFVPFCQLSFLSLCFRPSMSPNSYQAGAEEKYMY